MFYSIFNAIIFIKNSINETNIKAYHLKIASVYQITNYLVQATNTFIE